MPSRFGFLGSVSCIILLEADGIPFRHSHVLHAEDPEWVQSPRFGGVAERIVVLCCPEDVQKCDERFQRSNILHRPAIVGCIYAMVLILRATSS